MQINSFFLNRMNKIQFKKKYNNRNRMLMTTETTSTKNKYLMILLQVT